MLPCPKILSYSEALALPRKVISLFAPPNVGSLYNSSPKVTLLSSKLKLFFGEDAPCMIVELVSFPPAKVKLSDFNYAESID